MTKFDKNRKVQKPKKKFLKLPEYPGGKEALRKYIKENLVYPNLAIDKRIEGIVYLKAEIDDNGNVLNVWIEKGLGAGCDEEATRLIKNIQFTGVKNRGVRVKTKKRFRIEFKLPPQKKVNFNLVKTKPDSKKNVPDKTYTYTLKLN